MVLLPAHLAAVCPADVITRQVVHAQVGLPIVAPFQSLHAFDLRGRSPWVLELLIALNVQPLQAGEVPQPMQVPQSTVLKDQCLDAASDFSKWNAQSHIAVRVASVVRAA